MERDERILFDDIRPDSEPRAVTMYGAARLANHSEEDRFMKLPHLRKGSPPATHGAAQSYLQLGASQQSHRRLYLSEADQELGMLIAAQPGAGKTTAILYQGLFREEGHRSIFAIDPKNEIERDTAGWLSRHHDIVTFAPLDPAHSARFNPLAAVGDYQDAVNLAVSWLANTGSQSSDSFWINNERNVLLAAILHLVETSATIPPLVTLARFLKQPSKRLMDTLTHSESESARNVAAALFDYIGKAEQTLAGVMSGVINRLDLLENPAIHVTTSTSEIDFTAMTEDSRRPIALYLSIPDYAARDLHPLSSLFIAQMFTAWIRAANANNGTLKRPIACYMDEFTAAGRIPDFPRYIAMSRSRKISLILAIQSFSQLEAAYGREHTRTILTSIATHCIFPGLGQEEAEFYSRRMGQTTIQTQSNTRSISSAGGMLFTSGNTTEGESSAYAGRRLRLADELVYMEDGELIVLPPKSRPLLLRAIPAWQDKELDERRALRYSTPERRDIAPPRVVWKEGAPAAGAEAQVREPEQHTQATPKPKETQQPAAPTQKPPEPPRWTIR
jgi:type IV secretion system protein VirD4